MRKRLWDVYQMPKELGGDWVFEGSGVISDGYKTREEALEALADHLFETIQELLEMHQP